MFKGFVSPSGVEKLMLVVDGTWRQSDLDARARAGWDAIVNPDPMADIAKPIV